jgi:iron complex outermembrane receptor protein
VSQSLAATLAAVSLGASITAAAAATPELQELTVTAQRVEENLQTTPVSMTALSGEFLDKFAVARVTSLDMVTPNLIFNSGTGGSSGSSA